MIPHPNIPLLDIRTRDIWLLLTTGVLIELVSRALTGWAKRKNKQEVALQTKHLQVQIEAAKKRRLGPSAFVETSKLERSSLALEKQLTALAEERSQRTAQVSKLVRNGSLALYFLLFLVYYGIPIVAVDGLKIDSDDLLSSAEQRATSFLQGFMFPISYVGMGVKIARLGVPQPTSSIGALVVLWSSQVTVGKLLDGAEAMGLF